MSKEEIHEGQLIMIIFNIFPSEIHTFIAVVLLMFRPVLLFSKPYKRTKNYGLPAKPYTITFKTRDFPAPPRISLRISGINVIPFIALFSTMFFSLFQ